MTDTDPHAAARIAAAAAALAAARRTGIPVPNADLPEMPASPAEARAVQAAVAASLGIAAGGFKASASAPGQPATLAPIPAAHVLPSGATIDRSCRLRGVELEIAFRFEEDPPAPGTPDFAARLAAAVAMLPAIEVLDCRIADRAAAPDLWKYADSYINWGIVLGEPVRDWRHLSTTHVTRRLTIAGETVAQGPVGAPGGDAFRTLAELVEGVGSHCGGLRRGMVVTTGTLSGLLFAPEGAAVEGEIAGLGAVALRFG